MSATIQRGRAPKPGAPCAWCGEVPSMVDGALTCAEPSCPKWRPLTVYTARIGYVGLDALDITRKSATGDALVFAPSWSILRPALDARQRAGRLRAAAQSDDPAAGLALDEAQMTEDEAWAAYVPAYVAEMRASYRAHRPAWERLLGEVLLTLTCYCVDPERCHRVLLARDILPKLGATYAGERPPQRGTKADKLMDSVDEELRLAGVR